MVRKALLALLVLGVSACSGDTETDGGLGPELPARVAISQATMVHDALIEVSLRNEGGSGSYKLEFWALPTGPGGPSSEFVGASEVVQVTSGYEETVRWEYAGPFRSFVRVDAFSRGINTAVWTLTGTHPLN